MNINIQAVPAFKDNYLWLIINDKSEALVIDPGDDEPVLQILKENDLILTGILVTHKHNDHIGGIESLLRYFSVPVFGNKIENIPTVTNFIAEGDIIDIANFPPIKVMDVPGHTLGHVAYLMEDHLFCGDTLFGSGCGRLFEGTFDQLFSSLQKIKSLPNRTKIYCAHEYTLKNLEFAALVEPDNSLITERIANTAQLLEQGHPSLPSTLQLEKATNPFLRCYQETIKKSVEHFSGKSFGHDEANVFNYLRQWRNNW